MHIVARSVSRPDRGTVCRARSGGPAHARDAVPGRTMEIRTLKGVSREAIYRAFVEAFSDYEVDTRMSYDKFIEMMAARDLNSLYSIGGFDDGRLVSFILCGCRENGGPAALLWRRNRHGEGIPAQGGAGGALLGELIAFLKAEGVHRFELEVLEHNAPAIALYEKNGFARTRKFECFEAPASAFRGSALDPSGARPCFRSAL